MPTCETIISLAIQGAAALATFAAVCVSLRDSRQSRRLHDEDLKRYQAERVSSWFGATENESEPPSDNRFVWKHVVLRNASESPVYNVIVSCVGIQGAGPRPKGEDYDADYPCRRCVGTLPPGSWSLWLPTGGEGMHIVLATELAFTDARGTSWVRRGNGTLEEIKTAPQVFYKLSMPYEWYGCDPD